MQRNMFRLRAPMAAVHKSTSLATTVSQFRPRTLLPTEGKFYVVGARCFSVEPANKASSTSGPLDLSVDSLPAATQETSEVAAEATFRELGLAHSWPSGWVQAALEVVHNSSGLEWWAIIATATVCVRLMIFPIVIKSQKMGAKLQEHMPEIMRLQGKMAEATTKEEANKSQLELRRYMLNHRVNPFGIYVPLAGSSFAFMSMFFALRGMATAPVPSLKTEGTLWFVDLTATDPLYLLPILTASSLYVHIVVGGDGMRLESMPPIMRTILKVVPFVSFPAMCTFPTALNVYWFTNNFVSIAQSRFLRQPRVREYFGIPESKPAVKLEDTVFGFPGAGPSKAAQESTREGSVLRERAKQVETERDIREKIEREIREEVSRKVEERVQKEMEKRRGKTKE